MQTTSDCNYINEYLGRLDIDPAYLGSRKV